MARDELPSSKAETTITFPDVTLAGKVKVTEQEDPDVHAEPPASFCTMLEFAEEYCTVWGR